MLKGMFAVLTGTCISVATFAQERDIRREEIIIRKSGKPSEKMVIVIDGDSITVNGKPISGQQENITILRKIDRFSSDGQGTSPNVRIIGGEHLPMDGPIEFRMLDGKVPKQAFLGVNIEKADKGVKIVEVSPGTAAEKAGLKSGDVILSVGGEVVSEPEAFREQIRRQKPEEEVELVVRQQGDKKEKTMKVRLGSAPATGSFRMMIPTEPNSPEAPMVPGRPGAPRIRMFRNGEALGPIIEEEIERSFSLLGDRPQLGIRIQDTEAANGVTVLDVNEGSPAQKAGVKTDDLITAIDGKEIKDTDEAREALQTVREKSTYSLKLKREGKTMELQVQIPKKLKKATL